MTSFSRRSALNCCRAVANSLMLIFLELFWSMFCVRPGYSEQLAEVQDAAGTALGHVVLEESKQVVQVDGAR